jgi:hypothetical protein
MLSNLYRYFLNSAARLSQHCVLCGVGGQGCGQPRGGG